VLVLAGQCLLEFNYFLFFSVVIYPSDFFLVSFSMLTALEELKQQAPVTTNCQPVEAPSPDAAAICVM
jgi:hypothetical protein